MNLDSSLPASKEDEIYYFEPVSVPKAICQPDDQVETGLQGQVPQSDRPPNGARAASPYYCNLNEIGSFRGRAWATLDMYEDCAYYGVSPGGGGTQTVDVSDPTRVLPGEVLATPAMEDPWESMKANGKRALLAAGGQIGASPFLDVYDLSVDCRAPVLKASVPIPGANGHEGWWSPDGNTFWMTSFQAVLGGGEPGPSNNITAVDVADPMLPASLIQRVSEFGSAHGGQTSDDGNRAYMCLASIPGSLPGSANGLLIADVSDIQSRKPNPEIRTISFTPIPENAQCQGAYRVSYKGRPYAIVYGEAPGRACVESEQGPPLNTFAIPVIVDIADELHPRIVSRLLLEVDLPQNCDKVAGDGSGFVYDAHHCTPDRLHDPTILACANFQAGIRVFDIRDPLKPKELAYYNVSQVAGAFPASLGSVARPVVRTDRGEIWFTHDTTGFHVVKFAEGVWPFPESPKCSDAADWLFKQQNPTLECP